jgi:hypothetical protein
MAYPGKTEEQYQKLAGLLIQGNLTLYDALVEAGWSERQARKGRAAIPQRVDEIMLDRGVPLERTGRKLLADPERMEERVVGFLDDAMMRRTNKGVLAARLLAATRR